MNIATTLAAKKHEACPHTSRITIRALGIERQICESCDHVSFAFKGQELSEVDRARFSRPVDELAATQK